MFKYHNTVKISAGNKIIIAPNSVLDFKNAVYSNLPFGKYILIGSDAYCFKAETSLNYINTDIQKGALCAEYSAVFSDSPLDNKTFSKCGLSADGINYCNIATFEPFIKEEGKSFTISVTLYLTDAQGNSPSFAQGENPLAELLLGNKSVGQAGYAGTDFNMDTAVYTGDFSASDIKPASCIFNSSGISLQIKTSKIEAESIFTFDNKPALKLYNFKNSSVTANAIGVPNADKCVNLDFPVVSSLNLVRQGSIMSDTLLIHNFDKIVKTGNILAFDTGKNSFVKSDAFNNYAALLCGNELHFYSQENGAPVFKYKVPIGEYGYDVCAGGYLAVFGKNIKIYDKTGAVVCDLNLSLGSKNAIVNEGACFHLATAHGYTLKRYKIVNGDYFNLTSFTFSVEPELFRSFSKIGVAGKLIGYYFDSQTNTTSINTVLYGLYNKYGVISHIEFGDNAAYIKSSTGARFVNLADGNEINIAQNENCRVFGDLILISGKNQSRLYNYNRGKRILTEIKGNVDAQDISSVARLGNYIIVLTNGGKFETYYANKNGACAYNLSFNTTDEAVITLQSKQKQNAASLLTVTAKVSVAN